MKTNTLMAVVAVVGVATAGLLMWNGDAKQSPSPQSIASIPSALSSTPSPQTTQIHVSSEVAKKPPAKTKVNPPPEEKTKVNPPPEESSSSDLAAQLAIETQPMGPADACVEMAKTLMCPFIGKIPFIREMAGQIAIWAKTSCPTG